MQDLAGLLPLLIVVVLFWFLLVRPARNRQRQVLELQRSLQVGQRVVTAAGLHGTIAELTDREVVLEAAPSGALLTFDRQAVMRVVESREPGTQP